MAKRMSNKKRQSRRRALRGGADTDVQPAPVTDSAVTDAATADVTAAAATGPATDSNFMSSLFSTESTPAVTTTEEVKPATEAAVVMATTYKAKNATAKKYDSKSKKSDAKSKKNKKCKTKKGNCKKWFKLNKNKLCATASASPSL
jgi:hypothetical protein